MHSENSTNTNTVLNDMYSLKFEDNMKHQVNSYFCQGVTAIEPEWLPVFAPSLCNLSTPLTEPPPRYNPDTGTPYCHFSGTFGEYSQLSCNVNIDLFRKVNEIK